MDKKEVQVESEVIYDGKVIHVRKDKVLCPNGNYSYREIVDHHGGVGILAFVDNKVILIKQFRYAYNEEVYEIPAGKIEVNEAPEITGKRELEEETGYHVDKLVHLGNIYPSCGYTNEVIYLYLAKDLKKKETHFDDDENIDTFLVDYEEVLKMVKEGKIKDAKTICALQYYQNL